MATEKLSGTPNENPYGASNTNSYTEAITKQYADAVKAQNDAVDSSTAGGAENLATIQQRGHTALDETTAAADRDYTEMKSVESGIEQNNGNRQRIGHSQYGIPENNYDQQRAAIEAARAQLEKDVARQVADLKAQGEYAKADAALQAAQQRFQQLYADALRVDTNLRSNYEYQTGLQREDAAIQREQDASDTAWLRKMGEALMAKGVTPPDNMLAAMGIDSSAAQQYINKVVGVYSGYVGGTSGGGGSSGGGGGSPSESPNYEQPDAGSGDDIWGTVSSYNNHYASQVYTMAKAGNIDGALNWLGSKAAYFSEANAKTVSDMAYKYYNQSKSSASSSSSSNKSSGSSTKNTTSSSSSSSKKTTPTTTKKTSTTTEKGGKVSAKSAVK